VRREGGRDCTSQEGGTVLAWRGEEEGGREGLYQPGKVRREEGRDYASLER
jgi:hypothetical protein